jgi:hypothetical protein
MNDALSERDLYRYLRNRTLFDADLRINAIEILFGMGSSQLRGMLEFISKDENEVDDVREAAEHYLHRLG